MLRNHLISAINNCDFLEEDAVQVDMVGRVSNASLSTRQGIIALFEAVINSIDSIEESGIDNGRIVVNVLRDGLFSETENREQFSITGFDVVDNGSGFNTENFTSFNTSDSTKKMQIGGKGVGRFFWLKVFEDVQIESVFIEDGKTQRRSFNFALKKVEPIQSHDLIEVDAAEPIKTTVRLRKIRDDYATHMPIKVDGLAHKLLEHCLAYFVVGIMPNLLIIDGDQTFNTIFADFCATRQTSRDSRTSDTDN